MTDPWVARWPIDADTAQQRIVDRFPALQGATVVPFAAGWDNEAFLVDKDSQQYVFRFPRRPVAVQLMETELRWLPQLAPQLPTPVSNPVFRALPTAEAPVPFGGYRHMVGHLAHDVLQTSMPATAQQRLGTQLGRFLGTLHRLPASEDTEGLPPPGDAFNKADLKLRTRHLSIAKARLRRLLPADPVDELVQRVQQLATSTYGPAQELGWVHGDLDHRHVLLSDNGTLAGIIDWGDLHWGDPAVDLGVWWSVLPLGARNSFRAAYGPIDAATWRRAQGRCICHQLAVLEWAVKTERPAVAKAARRALLLASG